ncbi:MAG TPA: 2-dehydropantoate 2-reductase [Dehalococcoidia bacterium]|nr:2-dehydropantoate 2-reductase [Dehalococcoidia bacterium]
MKFAIVGAGATGGYIGAKLAQAGEDVILIARGAHLAAMQQHGVRVKSTNGDFTVRPPVTDDLATLAGADVVFLSLKAHSVPPIAERLSAALGPETAVITAQNGLPWWYFAEYDGPLAGTHLETVDPGRVISRSIETRRVIGGIVWIASRLAEPGVIDQSGSARLQIGELDGRESDRCRAISTALTKAGVECTVRPRIRQDIWLKLLGNVAFNPISALTRASLNAIVQTPESRALARSMMEETNSVALALGVQMEVSVEERLAGAGRVGGHKTSMLQDAEAGRPLEVEALLGAVVELGDHLGMALPNLRAIYACTKLLDWTIAESRV